MERLDKFEKISLNIRNYIDTCATEFNDNAQSHCNHVSQIIKQLNDYIDKKIYLSNKRIEILLLNLIRLYTVTLDVELNIDIEIVRAVKYEEFNSDKPYYDNAERLSFIPEGQEELSGLGRLNKNNEVMFYGCISNNDNIGIATACSEIKVLESEIVNILKSKTIKKLKLTYVGLFAHFKRGSNPSIKLHEDYELVYKYQKEKFNPYLMIAYQLCDAFFSDILRRKEAGNLYKITAMASYLYLKDRKVDGIIYSSVQSESLPVVVLKPSSVREKLKYTEALSIIVKKDYGYSIYELPTLFKGKILKNNNIEWKKIKCTN